MGDHVAMVKSVYEAFDRGDIEAVLGAMHEKIEWNEAENVSYDDGTTWVGPQAVLEKLFVRLGSEWTGFKVNVRDILECDDRVVVQARYTATYNETGKELDAQVVHIWTIRDGKLGRFDQYTDTLQFADVTGQRDREIVRKGALA